MANEFHWNWALITEDLRIQTIYYWDSLTSNKDFKIEMDAIMSNL